jgi:YhcH/YjgK/YiaL family protein
LEGSALFATCINFISIIFIFKKENVMIIDTLANLSNYESLHPNFPKAFAYLKELLAANVADGRHEPANAEDAKRFYATFMTAETPYKETASAEVHRKYIDIHLTLSGKELICVPTDADKLGFAVDYQPEKDMAFYEAVPTSDCHHLRVVEDQFVIVFTNELHAPMMGFEPTSTPATVRKVIMNILA